MAVREAEPVGSLQEVKEAGLDREDLLAIYRHMLMTRAIEERGHILYKQGKIPGSFYTGRGNEGAAVGVGTAKIDIIDYKENTIFVGADHGLKNGDKVTYQKSETSSTSEIGGLDDGDEDYAIDAGDGRIQLAEEEGAEVLHGGGVPKRSR